VLDSPVALCIWQRRNAYGTGRWGHLKDNGHDPRPHSFESVKNPCLTSFPLFNFFFVPQFTTLACLDAPGALSLACCKPTLHAASRPCTRRYLASHPHLPRAFHPFPSFRPPSDGWIPWFCRREHTTGACTAGGGGLGARGRVRRRGRKRRRGVAAMERAGTAQPCLRPRLFPWSVAMMLPVPVTGLPTGSPLATPPFPVNTAAATLARPASRVFLVPVPGQRATRTRARVTPPLPPIRTPSTTKKAATTSTPRPKTMTWSVTACPATAVTPWQVKMLTGPFPPHHPHLLQPLPPSNLNLNALPPAVAYPTSASFGPPKRVLDFLSPSAISPRRVGASFSPRLRPALPPALPPSLLTPSLPNIPGS